VTLRLLIQTPEAALVELDLHSIDREREILKRLEEEAPTDYYPEVVQLCLALSAAGCWITGGVIVDKEDNYISDIIEFYVRIVH
jgi:hypothetical protein